MFGSAQDELGIAGSNWSPVNTVHLNPTNIVDSKAFLDVEVAGAYVFARNNLAYIPGTSFRLRNLSQTPLPTYRRSAAPFSAFVDATVHLPSVSFCVKQHAFALTNAVRTYASVRGLPESLSYHITNGFNYQPLQGQTQNVKNLRIAALSWMETGLTYGTIVSRSGFRIMEGAISVKRLFGIAGVGMLLDQWNYAVRDSSQLETLQLSGQYGFNDFGGANSGVFNGKGWGVNLGFTIKDRMKESEGYTPHNPCTDGDYYWKLGVSLLDLGYIRFDQPFYRNRFTQEESNQWNDFNDVKFDAVSDLDSILNVGLGVSRQTADQSKFSMMLPAALSVQYDYNFEHGFYLLTIATIGAPWKNRLGVERSSYFGVIPRYETKRFEAAVPISFYQWRAPQVGCMLRFNNLIIGSDNLGWRIFKQRIYGADFYLSLKVTLFKHPRCKQKKNKKGPTMRRGSAPPPPCPAW